MPSPSTSLATLRPDLATFIEFDLAMDRLGFIGQKILPVLDVASQAGSFGKIQLAELLKNAETTRQNGGAYNRGNWKFDDESYACKENGFEEPIDDREAVMYANYFIAEQMASQRAYDAVLRNAEKRIAAMIFNATTWAGAALTTAVSTEWSTAASATPVADVEAAVRKVWAGTGLWPNALIVNRHVFRNLRLCAEVRERIVASGAGSPAKASDITPAMLASVFDLDDVIVAGGAKNTATEGQAAVIDKIWSDEYAMVARICRSQDMKEPGLGRTFHWAADGSQIEGTVEGYRDETVRGDIIRVRHDTHEKLLYVGAAHLLSNITA